MPRPRTSQRAARFWKRLVQNYGARLTDQFGMTCPEDWCEVIDRTDDDRLNQALLTIRREHLQFPPTLGQFEAAIPSRSYGAQDSIPDQLAQRAVSQFNLCEHQLWRPWSYFGAIVEGGKYPTPITNGVVVPPCSGCAKPSHRVKVEELA